MLVERHPRHSRASLGKALLRVCHEMRGETGDEPAKLMMHERKGSA
jgi:hypothetical protein